VTGFAALTLLVVLGALLLMMSDLASPDVVLLGGVVVLTAAGVITPARAVAGFANEGMLTVAALFVVAAGLRETGAVSMLTARLLGRPATLRGALARLVAPTMFASSVLNNTAVVATLLPAVHDWSRRLGVAPSRLLLPLSYAAILGGVVTLVGTSTNLVVAGLVKAELGNRTDLVEIGMFDMTPLGLAIAVGGGLVMVALGPWLLPDRAAAVSSTDDPRRYTMELMVTPTSRLAGRSIEDAGLRNLPGAFLMEIVRDGNVIPAVDAEVPLSEGDRLIFVGDVDAMVDLQRMPGLAAAPGQAFALAGNRIDRQIVEAVVAHRNPLLGRTIREGEFRSRYHAVVIAVSHAGERVGGRIGDIELHAGDVLLLEAHPNFVTEQRTRTDFYLVSSVEGATPPRYGRAQLALVILVLLVACNALGLANILVASSIGAGAMVLTRCCTVEEARRSLDLQVLVAIAAAFGLGAAMQSSGLDALIADAAVSAGAGSPIAALIAVYIVTALVTEVVTNNAAAVLAFPVALALADKVDANPMGFVFTVMMAASASFLTPIGYQTNLMVYNVGGYKAIDYPRAGLPLSVVAFTATIGLVPVLWPL
jgi:di/tricarboxylate transporter